jgi:cytochrome c
MLQLLLLFAATLVGTASTEAEPAPPPAFKVCAACHQLGLDSKNTVGPHLNHLFGRRAGSVERFAYSAAMRNSGVVWNADTLTDFLKAPSAFIPGNRMIFGGIQNDDQVEQLVNFFDANP